MKTKRSFLENGSRITGIILAASIGITCVISLVICVTQLIKIIIQ